MAISRLHTWPCAMLFTVGPMLWAFAATSMAGNAEMVEERVQELDAINKKAVRETPGLPQNGTVEIKARAMYTRDSIVFDRYETHIAAEKDGHVDLTGAHALTADQNTEDQP